MPDLTIWVAKSWSPRQASRSLSITQSVWRGGKACVLLVRPRRTQVPISDLSAICQRVSCERCDMGSPLHSKASICACVGVRG